MYLSLGFGVGLVHCLLIKSREREPPCGPLGQCVGDSNTVRHRQRLTARVTAYTREIEFDNSSLFSTLSVSLYINGTFFVRLLKALSARRRTASDAATDAGTDTASARDGSSLFVVTHDSSTRTSCFGPYVSRTRRRHRRLALTSRSRATAASCAQ